MRCAIRAMVDHFPRLKYSAPISLEDGMVVDLFNAAGGKGKPGPSCGMSHLAASRQLSATSIRRWRYSDTGRSGSGQVQGLLPSSN